MSTLVSFYAGAYGPTLLVAPQSTKELESFERLLCDLAEGRVESCDLTGFLECELDSLGGLTLRTVGVAGSGRLVRSQGRPDRPSFDWSNTPEEWRDCASLVRRLREWNAAGHQYLTREGFDDALVEVSFGEVKARTDTAEP